MWVGECEYTVYAHNDTQTYSYLKKAFFCIFSSLESVLAQIFDTYTTFTIAFLGNYTCQNSEFL